MTNIETGDRVIFVSGEHEWSGIVLRPRHDNEWGSWTELSMLDPDDRFGEVRIESVTRENLQADIDRGSVLGTRLVKAKNHFR